MFKYKNSIGCVIFCFLTMILAGCETVVTEPGEVTTLRVNSYTTDDATDSDVVVSDIVVVDADGVALDFSALTEVQQQLANRIIEQLSVGLQRSPTEVTLLHVEEVEWPDSSLGCPAEGEAYAQMITSGYRMEMEVEGEKHVYHTSNRPNSRLVESCAGE